MGPPADLDAAVLEVVLVDVGGFRIAVEATGVAGLRPFDGGADPEGGIPWIEDIVGVARPPSGPRRILLLRPTGRSAEGERLSVPSGAALATLPAAAIHRLPALVAARTTVRSLKAVALDTAGLILLLDPCAAIIGTTG